MTTESLLHQKQIIEGKLFKVRNFLENSTDPEWMNHRVKSGESRATAYILSKELEESDFMQWARNAARVAQMNQTLRTKKTQLENLLKQPTPIPRETDVGDLRKNPVITNYLEAIPPYKRDLVVLFLDSPMAQQILTTASRFKLLDREGKADFAEREFANRFAGAVWEGLAYFHLRERLQSKGQVLVSPNETFELYRNIYPEREVVFNDLAYGIKNQSFPDGLIIEQKTDHLSLEEAVEYKSWRYLNGHGDQLENQINNFRRSQLEYGLKLVGARALNPLFHSKILHTFQPHLSQDLPVRVSDNYKVTVVLPEDSDIHLPGASYISVPFKGVELNTFLQVLKNYLKHNQK